MIRKNIWVVLASIIFIAVGCTSQKEVENTPSPTTQTEEEKSGKHPETEKRLIQ